MDTEKELPKRKSTRLKNYDYSSSGSYFVTICARDRKQIFSEIIKVDFIATNDAFGIAVGEGLAPPEYCVKLKPCGEVAEEQLKLLEDRFGNIDIEDYVIMPDHIHMIIFIHKDAGGASPSPTLDDIVCVFKSFSSRICKQRYGIERMFQRSYAEHIIRDREDHAARKNYIIKNPKRWYLKNEKIEE